MHHLKCVRCLRKLGLWGDLGILLGSWEWDVLGYSNKSTLGGHTTAYVQWRHYSCIWQCVDQGPLFRWHDGTPTPHLSSLGRLTKMGLIESRSRCFVVFQSLILDRSSYHSSSQWGERCNHSTYGAMEERLLLSIPCHQLAGIS